MKMRELYRALDQRTGSGTPKQRRRIFQAFNVVATHQLVSTASLDIV